LADPSSPGVTRKVTGSTDVNLGETISAVVAESVVRAEKALTVAATR
jgi:hypothetical protein